MYTVNRTGRATPPTRSVVPGVEQRRGPRFPATMPISTCACLNVKVHSTKVAPAEAAAILQPPRGFNALVTLGMGGIQIVRPGSCGRALGACPNVAFMRYGGPIAVPCSRLQEYPALAVTRLADSSWTVLQCGHCARDVVATHASTGASGQLPLSDFLAHSGPFYLHEGCLVCAILDVPFVELA